MTQSKGIIQPVETSVSQFSTLISDSIFKFVDDFPQDELTQELLDAYNIVLLSKAYGDTALSNLLYTINRVLTFTAELSRIRNQFYSELPAMQG